MTKIRFSPWAALAVAGVTAACSSDENSGAGAPEAGIATGGAAQNGGTGGKSGSGGSKNSTGGAKATGGLAGTGGSANTGGATGTGGTTNTGGVSSTGGVPNTGGANTGGADAGCAAVASQPETVVKLVQVDGAVVSEPQPCEFKIPPPCCGNALDPHRINFALSSSGGGGRTVLHHVASAIDCAEFVDAGWYYDDNAAPTEILLCPSACNTVTHTTGANLQVLFGCATENASTLAPNDAGTGDAHAGDASEGGSADASAADSAAE